MMIENVDIKIFTVIVSLIVGFTFCAGLCFAFFWGRRWATKNERVGETRVRAVRTPNTKDNANSEFLHSLETAHKRLEAVLARAEVTEQKLCHLTASADAGKPDSYATAAFLLANGEAVDRVASRLNLSPTQVRLVQKLQQELAEKTDEGTEEREERVISLHKQSGGKNGLGYRENLALGKNGVCFVPQ